MNLRHHPQLRHQWPPGWGGSYGPGDKFPSPEEPEKLLSVEESEKRSIIRLKAEYQGRQVTGVVKIGDLEFRSKLLEVLRQNIGKSIKEIGSLDIRF